MHTLFEMSVVRGEDTFHASADAHSRVPLIYCPAEVYQEGLKVWVQQAYSVHLSLTDTSCVHCTCMRSLCSQIETTIVLLIGLMLFDPPTPVVIAHALRMLVHTPEFHPKIAISLICVDLT